MNNEQSRVQCPTTTLICLEHERCAGGVYGEQQQSLGWRRCSVSAHPHVLMINCMICVYVAHAIPLIHRQQRVVLTCAKFRTCDWRVTSIATTATIVVPCGSSDDLAVENQEELVGRVGAAVVNGHVPSA